MFVGAMEPVTRKIIHVDMDAFYAPLRTPGLSECRNS